MDDSLPFFMDIIFERVGKLLEIFIEGLNLGLNLLYVYYEMKMNGDGHLTSGRFEDKKAFFLSNFSKVIKIVKMFSRSQEMIRMAVAIVRFQGKEVHWLVFLSKINQLMLSYADADEDN